MAATTLDPYPTPARLGCTWKVRKLLLFVKFQYK